MCKKGDSYKDDIEKNYTFNVFLNRQIRRVKCIAVNGVYTGKESIKIESLSNVLSGNKFILMIPMNLSLIKIFYF